MSAADSVAKAREWATFLELREVARSGLSRAEVRPIVARRAGIPVSKLYSLAKRRLKDTGSWKDALCALFIRELELELQHVRHDQQIGHQIGLAPDHREMAALAKSEARLLQALGRDGGGR